MRSASEWAQVRALATDGASQREIAARLGVNRRTVRRLVEAAEPPRYRRPATGSMLDPLDHVLRKLVADFDGIKAPRVAELLREDYGYAGRSIWFAGAWRSCGRGRSGRRRRRAIGRGR